MKRLFDFIIAFIIITLLTIPIIILAIVIHYKLGSPVFFKQMRPGRNGKPFQMIKFRTMTEARGMDGALLDDANRLTSFGRFLRSTSLDELPSLWSVLRGDMSLVGPRPLLIEYLPLYTREQARRHDVLPGITGWAQVNGRNAISWEQKFELDNWYIQNQSFLLDVKILWLTFRKVFMREGISAQGEATMTAFKGSPNHIQKTSFEH